MIVIETRRSVSSHKSAQSVNKGPSVRPDRLRGELPGGDEFTEPVVHIVHRDPQPGPRTAMILKSDLGEPPRLVVIRRDNPSVG
jgi:hypothetical protein